MGEEWWPVLAGVLGAVVAIAVEVLVKRSRLVRGYRSTEERVAWALAKADELDELKVSYAKKGPLYKSQREHAGQRAAELRLEAARIAAEASESAPPCPDAGGRGGYR